MRALPDEQGPSLQNLGGHSFCFALPGQGSRRQSDPHRLHHGRFLSHPDGPDGHPEGLPDFHGLDASGDFTSSPKELSGDRIVYVRHSARAAVAAFDQRYKLVLSNADKPWLFDLQTDPDELRNFSAGKDTQK